MRGERPWAVTAEALARGLGGSLAGLDPGEAAARLARLGANELPEPRRRPLALRLLDQLTHFMALLLCLDYRRQRHRHPARHRRLLTGAQGARGRYTTFWKIRYRL